MQPRLLHEPAAKRRGGGIDQQDAKGLVVRLDILQKRQQKFIRAAVIFRADSTQMLTGCLQKLVLQLRDTLVYDESSESGQASPPPHSAKAYEDVVESFVGMGFDRKLVVKALEKILAKSADELRTLSKEEAENYVFPLLLRSLS